MLLRGQVKIKTITPDGKETIFAFFEEGELFGGLRVVFDNENAAPRSRHFRLQTDAPRGAGILDFVISPARQKLTFLSETVAFVI